VQTKGAFQVLQVLPTLAAFDPGVVDNFDLNKMIRGMARAFSVSEEYMMKEDTVKKLQKARAEQQQMMTELQIAKDGSEAAKNAADAGLLGREM
jgi:alcohol dehydrogenase YqhD (iron-dependent ADH family)